jgi:hypothetical protein
MRNLYFIFIVLSKQYDWHFVVQAASGSIPSAETSSSDVEEEVVKSETYSNNMTEAMGAGMFNHIMLFFCQQPSFIILSRYWSNNDLYINVSP